MNMNDNLYDSLPVIGQLTLCVAIVATVPIWFPFWILQELKQGRIEKQNELEAENKEAIEELFQQIRKDLK